MKYIKQIILFIQVFVTGLGVACFMFSPFAINWINWILGLVLLIVGFIFLVIYFFAPNPNPNPNRKKNEDI